MILRELPYPLRLCTELMHFAGLGANGMTDDMKASEIKAAVGVFFPPDMVDLSRRILSADIGPDELRGLVESSAMKE